MSNTTDTKTTMVHIRVNRSLRNDVKKLADSMGVSLSLVGETFFKKFLEERRLIINESYVPNKNLKTILDEAEKNRDNSKYWNTHNSVRDLMADLKK